MYSKFKASLPNKNITHDVQVEGAPLKVQLLAIVPGTQLPLRDENGVAVETFSASEDLIKGAVSSSRGGLFTVNHEDPIKSRIGVFDSVNYNNGLIVNGTILCNKWRDHIIKGEYSGISVEGSIEGEMKRPSKMEIYAVSFLNESEGACPLIDESGNPACKVDIMNDEEEDIEASKIEAAWDGSAAKSQIWSYATDKDGNVVPSKAKKCFLKVDGDPKEKGSYSYPYVTIQNGVPVPNHDGLIAALHYASGARGATKDPSVLRKIKTIMSREGMDLPSSLQARLEQKSTIKDGERSIVASIVDPVDDSILSEKEILIINDSNLKGAVMPEENKVTEARVEAAAVVETSAEPKVEASSAPEVVVETPIVEAPPTTPAAIEVPAPDVVEQPKLDVWDVIRKELGISSKDDFVSIKTNAEKYAETQSKLDAIIKENTDLKSFKIEKQKEMLKSIYPPALTKDLDAFYAEYLKDPLEFTQKYSEDASKFAASKSVTLQGSAVESEDTEKTRRELEIHNAVNYLYKKNGRSL